MTHVRYLLIASLSKHCLREFIFLVVILKQQLLMQMTLEWFVNGGTQ
jgi:hypothetical protein